MPRGDAVAATMAADQRAGESDPEGVTAEACREGMRRFGAAVSIIAAEHAGEKAGLTATAVCSVSTAPPRLLVCINRDTRAHSIVTQAGRLSVNVLSTNQLETARRFAGMVPGIVGEERFDGEKWSPGVNGSTLVLADAPVSFECAVSEALASGTHSVFICDVVNVTLGTPEKNSDPLLYLGGQFRSLAGNGGPEAVNQAARSNR